MLGQSLAQLSLAAPLISLGFYVPVAVWLGMMLLSSSTLAGLDERSARELHAIRRSFVRLLFRAIIWLGITLALNLFIYGLFTANQHPQEGLYVIGFFSFILWFYVVVGSLYHAWTALRYLAEPK